LFTWYELLLIIGVTQGTITSIILFAKRDQHSGNVFLAFALLGFSLLSIKMVINTLNLDDTMRVFRFPPFATELALSPLFYFYVRTIVTPHWAFSKEKLIHFIPFIVFQTYGTLVYVHMLASDIADHHTILTNLYQYDWVKRIEDYLVPFSIFVYLLLGRTHVKHFNDLQTNEARYITQKWVNHIYRLSAVLGVFVLFNLLLDIVFTLNKTTSLHWKIYFIYVATLIYFIGFKGYQLQALQGYVSKQHTPKKVKDRLPRQRVVEIATKFEADVLDQKQYLNPKLSSQEVAEQLNVNQSALSYAINQQFGKSFRDLINEYRTNEVKTKLQDADYTNVSILAIALECGFNSEASFYRIFKKSTGMSPKDYSSL
jgi:AraC-like DNA-binding protein/uncharacterized protein YqgQ